jgi:hypothetical protein
MEILTGEPYVYGYNNPLLYGDPSGFAAQVILGPTACATGVGCVVGGGSILCSMSSACRDAASEVANEVASTFENIGNWIDGGDDDDAAEEYAPAPYHPSEAKDECPTFDRDPAQDKKVTDRELKEAGLDAHDLKEGRKGTDIYKDREGNLYEKPKPGRGPGDPLGINIKDKFR